MQASSFGIGFLVWSHRWWTFKTCGLSFSVKWHWWSSLVSIFHINPNPESLSLQFHPNQIYFKFGGQKSFQIFCNQIWSTISYILNLLQSFSTKIFQIFQTIKSFLSIAFKSRILPSPTFYLFWQKNSPAPIFLHHHQTTIIPSISHLPQISPYPKIGSHHHLPSPDHRRVPPPAIIAQPPPGTLQSLPPSLRCRG